jgi:hypothetical protein
MTCKLKRSLTPPLKAAQNEHINALGNPDNQARYVNCNLSSKSQGAFQTLQVSGSIQLANEKRRRLPGGRTKCYGQLVVGGCIANLDRFS